MAKLNKFITIGDITNNYTLDHLYETYSADEKDIEYLKIV